MQIHQQAAPYDAIVVGSGATGGVAAKELGERGLRVLVLEAGRDVDPQRDQQNPVRDMARRAVNLATRKHIYQATHPGYWKANPDFFCRRAGTSLHDTGAQALLLDSRAAGGRQKPYLGRHHPAPVRL